MKTTEQALILAWKSWAIHLRLNDLPGARIQLDWIEALCIKALKRSK